MLNSKYLYPLVYLKVLLVLSLVAVPLVIIVIDPTFLGTWFAKTALVCVCRLFQRRTFTQMPFSRVERRQSPLYKRKQQAMATVNLGRARDVRSMSMRRARVPVM